MAASGGEGFNLCSRCRKAAACSPITTQGAIALPGRYTRHYGSICDTQALHTVDLQFAIDYRHSIAAHFCRARLMLEGAKPVAKETL